MLDELSQQRDAGVRALAIALAVALVVVTAEVAGGILTNSLALLADAGHMVSDLLAISIALVAIWMARRPAAGRRTFGYQRAEVLAAALNGGILLLVAAFVFWQAALRFGDPPHVDSGPMLVIGVVGLVANVVSAYVLRQQQAYSMNVRGAFYHVLGDMAGSVGVIVAGAVMLTTGWRYADPLLPGGSFYRLSQVGYTSASMSKHGYVELPAAPRRILGLGDTAVVTTDAGIVIVEQACE